MSGVLDEHLSYLTLYNRTGLFRAALDQVIAEDARVADLGCGVGVLGFMALDAGAARVYGIDHSGAIELARETARRAGFDDRFVAIAGSTFHTTLPQPVDALICDHVGYFGFDYGIVAMVEDARRRMLKPGGQIVPRSIDLYVAGASCAKLREQSDAWQDPRIPADLHWIREYDVNRIVPTTLDVEAICTDSALAATIDLCVDTPEYQVAHIELTANRDASLDGIAGWFDAELAEGVRMTNSPLSPDRIARPHAILPLGEPIALRAGEKLKITLQLRHDPVTIAWRIEHPASGATRRQSSWRSTILGREDLVPPTDKPQQLGPEGIAMRAVLQAIDGQRDARAIEDFVLSAYPDLFPSPATLQTFVRQMLVRAAR